MHKIINKLRTKYLLFYLIVGLLIFLKMEFVWSSW